MQRVTFVQQYCPYNIGEVAGFDDEVAARLVSRGIAEVVMPPAAVVQDVPTFVAGVPQVVTGKPAVRPTARKRQ